MSQNGDGFQPSIPNTFKTIFFVFVMKIFKRVNLYSKSKKVAIVVEVTTPLNITEIKDNLYILRPPTYLTHLRRFMRLK